MTESAEVWSTVWARSRRLEQSFREQQAQTRDAACAAIRLLAADLGYEGSLCRVEAYTDEVHSWTMGRDARWRRFISLQA
jgi:hypothetical protein